MAPFDLLYPRSVDAALAELRSASPGDVAILAGGTDLLLDIDRERIAPRRVVSLRYLPWKFLEWSGDSLTIGSTLPLRTLESDPLVRQRIPGLWEAVRAVGSVALRHRATLGGNLVRSAPASDLSPILLALDAEVEVVGPRGSRWMPVDGFLSESRRPKLAFGELLRAVRIPEARPSAYRWQRVRPVNDISQVGVAVARSPSTGSYRIAVGDLLPRPVRIRPAEEAVRSRPPTDDEMRSAAALAARLSPFASDRRGTEAYRRLIVEVLVRRALLAIQPPALRGSEP